MSDQQADLQLRLLRVSTAGALTPARRHDQDYAPHYYDPLTMTRHAYDGKPAGIDNAFAAMNAKAAE